MYKIIYGVASKESKFEVYSVFCLCLQEDTGVNHGNVTVGLMPSLDQIAAVTSQGEVQFELMKKVQSCALLN